MELGDRVAIVVAHPDDESLWFGGLIYRAAQITHVSVICCTVPRLDSERAILFYDACEVLGASPRLIPFEESEPTELVPHLAMIDLAGYSSVVTHGPGGDYGHLHHQQVHHYCMMNARCPVYGTNRNGQFRLVLSERESQAKLAAIQCYNHTTKHGGVKHEELLRRYGRNLLTEEHYDRFS